MIDPARLRLCLVLTLLIVPSASAQYPWPVDPVDAQHQITGTFSEYRDTGSAPHFHDGVDIPKPDRSPVYAVADGRVTDIQPDYIRVENFAYIHVAPAPNLSLGDSVYMSRTVVGTILDGYGHVHLKDGFSQVRQPLRPDGLTPYEDPWPPRIDNVRFYSQPTRQPLAANELTGPVEITFRVREQNAPPGSSENRLNNGAYTVGYKVLSRDRQEVVHVPGGDGVQFRFDVMPPNSYVHNVFDRTQSSTDNHVYIVTNEVDRASAWDTALLPEGDYTVMLFAGDTRGNQDTAYVDVTVRQYDIMPPPQTTLLSSVLEDGRASFSWTGGDAEDLAGYRLYRSASPSGPWTIWPAGEAVDAGARQFVWDAGAEASFYHIAAIDTMEPPNEGLRSDVYGLAPDPHGLRLLVVDGFDRHGGSGSWQSDWHSFAAVHGRAIAAAGFGFEAAANEAVLAGAVDLPQYDAVFWMLGDESTQDETFSTAEQALVRAYLEAGGRFFVSGSELGWDLGRQAGSADRAFLNDYLKVGYAGDDAGNYAVQGAGEGIFQGLRFGYGSSPYQEDYPDYFQPSGGGLATLQYGNGHTAGVQYAGTFGAGSDAGSVVVLGFPFETISGQTAQNAVMERVLGYFFPERVDAEEPDAPVAELSLSPGYPNPFRAQTTIAFSVPQRTHVKLSAYDVLGRRVARLADAVYVAGAHRVEWSPELPQGTYFIRLETEGGIRSRTVTLLR